MRKLSILAIAVCCVIAPARSRAAAIQQITLTVYGQPIGGIKIPIGSTVNWNITLQDPITRVAVNLTGANVVMSVSALNASGNAIQPPVISRQATITDAVNGKVLVPWADGDTAPNPGTPLRPGAYGFDLWLTDASGNRLQALMFGQLQLTPASGLPGNPVTPLPSQAPLSQGPQGPPGFGTIETNGTPVTPRTIVNFAPVFSVVDNSGATRTDFDLAAGGILNAKLANPSLTISTTSPIGGGGAVALGASLTLTCATCVVTSGSYADPSWITSLSVGKIAGLANQVIQLDEVAQPTHSNLDFRSAFGVAEDIAHDRTMVSIKSAGITNAMLVNPQSTLSTSGGIIGGGTLSLGGSLSLSLTYGSSSNTITQGNDVRLLPAPSAQGKVPYDTGAAYAELAVGASGQVLTTGGASANPSWSSVVNSISASNGVNVSSSTGSPAISLTYGSSSNTVTQGNDSRLPPAPTQNGNIIYDTGAAYATVARGAANTLLHGNGVGSPSFSNVANADLANSSVTVSTTSPLGGGGALSLGGTLTLTCSTCLTGSPSAIGDLLYSTSGGQALTALADVAAGSFLRSGGVASAPAWSTTTWPNAATTGDLVVATGANTFGRLADVSTGQVLRSGGVGVAFNWGALINSDLPASGVSAGSYIYNTVNDRGIVTTGSNTIGATPTFGAGALASGATAFDLSGSSAAFKSTTGTNTLPAATIIVGAGDGTASVTGATIREPSITGTDILGTDMLLAAGLGTGAAGASQLRLQAPIDTGSTGTSAQTVGTVLRITNVAGVPTTILGRGEATATPVAPVMRTVNAAGTNISGVALTIEPGMGTGSATAGNMIFQYGPAGGSGTTGNTPTSAVTINGATGLLTALVGETVTGAFTQTTGAFSATGNAASSLSTSSGALTLDAATAANLGTTNATSVVIGNLTGSESTTIKGASSGLTMQTTGSLTFQTNTSTTVILADSSKNVTIGPSGTPASAGTTIQSGSFGITMSNATAVTANFQVTSAGTTSIHGPFSSDGASFQVTGTGATNSSVVGITGTAVATGAVSALKITPVSNTGQTANTDIPGVWYNASGLTRTWATSSFLPIQREVRLDAPTYAAAAGSMIGIAPLLSIDGPPVAGSNVTIFNPIAFQVRQGNTSLGGAILTPFGGSGRFENDLLWSEQFQNAAWVATNITVTTDSVAAPNGTTTADLLNATASNGMVIQDSGIAAANITWTGSVWLRTDSGTTVASVRVDHGATTGVAYGYTLDTQWRRVVVQQVWGAVAGNAKFAVVIATNGANVYAWGAQLEQQTSPGAYLITLGTAQTTTQNATLSDLPLVAAHESGGNTPPTVATGTGAGASATASVAGNDKDFILTVNTNNADTPAANATIATVTFASSWTTAPHAVCNPSNDAAWNLAYGVVRERDADASTTIMTIRSGATPLPATTTATYTLNCHVFN